MIRRIFTIDTHHVVFISKTSCLCLYMCKINQHYLHKKHVTISIKSNTTSVISVTRSTYTCDHPRCVVHIVQCVVLVVLTIICLFVAIILSVCSHYIVCLQPLYCLFVAIILSVYHFTVSHSSFDIFTLFLITNFNINDVLFLKQCNKASSILD